MHNCIIKRNRKTLLSHPTFIDLFCGAGLFSEGLRSSGLCPVYAVDLDSKSVASYRRNVAQVAEVDDARNIPTDVKGDVLIAGPPCQGFSTLGRRDPKDARNKLSLVVPDWAQAVDAKIVVVENVPKFLETSTAKRMINALEHLDYSIETYVLEATQFGAAQFRQRVFIIASKSGPIGVPIPTVERPRTVREEVLDRPIDAFDPMHRWPEPGALALERFKTIPNCGDKRDIMRLRPDLCPPSWARLGCNATDVWGRINPDKPSNTIRCTFQNPSKGRYIHPFENRALSLREGARLQGVPDSWIFCGEPYPIARQIGNGVPVPLAKAIGGQIVATFNRMRRKGEMTGNAA